MVGFSIFQFCITPTAPSLLFEWRVLLFRFLHEQKMKALGRVITINLVYDIPAEIDDQIGRVKLAAMGLAIDTLTPEQEAYLSGWEA